MRRFDVARWLGAGVVIIAFLVFAGRAFTPSWILSNGQVEEYERFKAMDLRGKITAMGASRGHTVKVDNHAGKIEMPGFRSLGQDLHWETGAHIGDSLIKIAGSDTFRLITNQGTLLGVASLN